ncbi:MAG TPA: hypothetical protein VFE94_03020 [Candidatus Paceibacterota bacterium]|nr:hypothetical protein [Candidatus Paceibacterota bacterium]
MRLFFVLFSAAVSLVIFPSSLTNAQAVAVFEDADASVETSVLAASISPVESVFASFGNGIGVQSLLIQPTISPRENDNVSWGNADATLQATTAPPIFPPAVNFEELLAEKFKPILYFHEEERFRPQEIQVVLDTADIVNTENHIVEETSPLAPTDLSSRTESHYKLNLDGNTFIEHIPFTDIPYKNTAYAHILEDEGHIVLQYWFFYYYNSWEGGPDHEGDWEFIQLIFEQNKSIEEVVKQSIWPERSAYSAHLGGYRSNWDNVEKENDRPVVYVAEGSHANHFQRGVCDVTIPTGIGSDRGTSAKKLGTLDLRIVIDSILGGPSISTTPQKWLLFGGRWGEDDVPFVKESPRGPLQQPERWPTPISWTNLNTITWDDFYNDSCDGDFDGIWNNVDTQPNDPSNDFDAPGPLGRNTSGTITNRGDRDIKIRDAAVGGAHITADFGSERATIKFDTLKCITLGTLPVIGPFLSIPKFVPFIGTTTCGSMEVAAEEGSAELQITVGTLEVVGTVSAGQILKYDVVDDQLVIETSGEGEIPLVINGKSTIVQAGDIFSVHEVQIDIKPGSDTNPMNCEAKGNGVIPVAILTTDAFDATTVDHTTVLFEGASETHKSGKNKAMTRHEEDVDKDGDVDLVSHFRQNETTLTCESTEATLFGKTFSGNIFVGTDSIDSKDK